MRCYTLGGFSNVQILRSEIIFMNSGAYGLDGVPNLLQHLGKAL